MYCCVKQRCMGLRLRARDCVRVWCCVFCVWITCASNKNSLHKHQKIALLMCLATFNRPPNRTIVFVCAFIYVCCAIFDLAPGVSLILFHFIFQFFFSSSLPFASISCFSFTSFICLASLKWMHQLWLFGFVSSISEQGDHLRFTYVILKFIKLPLVFLLCSRFLSLFILPLFNIQFVAILFIIYLFCSQLLFHFISFSFNLRCLGVKFIFYDKRRWQNSNSKVFVHDLALKMCVVFSGIFKTIQWQYMENFKICWCLAIHKTFAFVKRKTFLSPSTWT